MSLQPGAALVGAMRQLWIVASGATFPRPPQLAALPAPWEPTLVRAPPFNCCPAMSRRTLMTRRIQTFLFCPISKNLQKSFQSASTAVSVPMILDRDTDAMTTAIPSLKAVGKNPAVMLLWPSLIVLLVGVSVMLPMAIGLAVVGPLLGHASWHAYRNSMRWPQLRSLLGLTRPDVNHAGSNQADPPVTPQGIFNEANCFRRSGHSRSFQSAFHSDDVEEKPD